MTRDERPANCKAVQSLDQMRCARCGLLWDLDDDDPPNCLINGQLRERQAKETADERRHLHNLLDDD